jgi:hypothetical protein
VPIFEGAIQQTNSNIGTSYSLIWNPENTSSTTFGALGSVSSTAVLKDVIIQNIGTVTVFAGNGTQTAGGSAGSLAIPVGGYVLISGYSVTNPSGVVGQLWGNTTTGTGSTLAGLASVVSVV